MIIRPYAEKDKAQCIAIFDSNCPKFFDESERDMLILWLDHQGDNSINYKSPTYNNAEADAYYVIEIPNTGVIACAGFYILKDVKEARLAWGMIHSDFHHKGFGTIMYNHRRKKIKELWPHYLITLGTSQHTFGFYQKMGMQVMAIFKDGYGVGLDRYDMEDSRMNDSI